MRRLASPLCVLVLALAGNPARGQEPTPQEPTEPTEPTAPTAEPSKPPAEKPTKPEDTALDHRFQVGLGLRAGSGYRVIMPYNEEFCGEKDKSVCGGRQPFWLEISPSFGLTSALELLVDVRLTLEEDFSRSRGFFFAPGIKYYTDAQSLFKFFFTGQVVLENQEQKSDPDLDDFDVGIRSALGVQFDILRYVGLYAQGGIVIGFKRWLTFVVDFAGGIQVRY